LPRLREFRAGRKKDPSDTRSILSLIHILLYTDNDIQDGSRRAEKVHLFQPIHKRSTKETNPPTNRRNKISADPNNTAWAKSKDNYGHRLLAKSGWQPGQYLGAENANHSEHYTAANASHIRVVLRDDNAGLGAQKGKSNADTFGLATLSGIFGRLNGKSEVEVQKQADTQRDLELQTYQAQKWGGMNFVYGGLLVGDKMEEDEKKKLAEWNAKVTQGKRKAGEEAPAEAEGSSKKRKHGNESKSEGSESSDDSEAVKEKKQKKKSKKGEAAADSSSESAERAAKKERKEKRRKDGKTSGSEDKAQAKEEKRARKEERRKRREEKRRRKEAKGKTSTQTSRDASSDSSEDEAPEVKKPAAVVSFAGGRHAVRQRYIMQKRQAGMNPQAMAEILMLKAGA
jgi:Pin2-interacting protein X1